MWEKPRELVIELNAYLKASYFKHVFGTFYKACYTIFIVVKSFTKYENPNIFAVLYHPFILMEAYINKMLLHLLLSITKRIFQDVQKDTWSITASLGRLGILKFTPPALRNCSKYPPDSGGSCRIYSGAWCGMQPKESFSRVFGQAGKCSISSAIHWDPRGNWDRKSGFQIIGVFLMMSFGSQHRTVPLCYIFSPYNFLL